MFRSVSAIFIKKNTAVCCYRPCLNIAVKWFERLSKAVLRIRIHMFLGLLDQDPSIIKQKKVRKALISTVL